MLYSCRLGTAAGAVVGRCGMGGGTNLVKLWENGCACGAGSANVGTIVDVLCCSNCWVNQQSIFSTHNSRYAYTNLHTHAPELRASSLFELPLALVTVMK